MPSKSKPPATGSPTTPPSSYRKPTPVSAGEEGEGLPYAPENWPEKGDNWFWKVGKRKNSSGVYADRYLIIPKRLQENKGKLYFASKKRVVEFLKAEFPNVNVDDFFALFEWGVPAPDKNPQKGGKSLEKLKKELGATEINETKSPKIIGGCKAKNRAKEIYAFRDSEKETKAIENGGSEIEPADLVMHYEAKNRAVGVANTCGESEKEKNTEIGSIDVVMEDEVQNRVEKNGSSEILGKTEATENTEGGFTGAATLCKAGNRECSSQLAGSYFMKAMDCNICCREVGICRDCSCVLCGKSIERGLGGHSFIRCEAVVRKEFVCGHVAHLECAVLCQMAGTVRNAGLDVEYYCRRCDNKRELFSHVSGLLQYSESLDSRDEIEKNLKLGVRILCGSRKFCARSWLKSIELVLHKLKNGAKLKGLWDLEDSSLVMVEGEGSHPGNDVNACLSSSFNFFTHPESQIKWVLWNLRKSQEEEYRIAEQKLCAQKEFLLSLYQQLDKDKHLLVSSPSPEYVRDLATEVLRRVDQTKQELLKFSCMTTINKGFGKTPKNILIEHFGLSVED
ncbi:hypothetical protein AMTRI_Chr03g148840 [Amborella trichopoda]